MRDIIADLSDTKLVKTVIKANWEIIITVWGAHQAWNYPSEDI
jgi:hypothetical protein